jgi:tetratricopeptide (TPR) repeat protein
MLDEFEQLVATRPVAAVAAIEQWLADTPPSFVDGVKSRVLLARALRAAGDLGRATSTLDDTVALVERGVREGHSISASALIRATAETFANYGRAQVGIAICLRLAPIVPDDEQVDLLLALGALHRDAGLLAEATHYADSALRLIDGLGDHERECRLLNNRGVLKLDLGDYADAAVDFERGERVAERIGLDLAAASCRHNRGVALARQGHVHEALELLDQSASFFEREGQDYALLEALLDRAALLLDCGLTAEARAAATLSAQAHTRRGAAAGLERTRYLQSQIESADGKWSEAARYAQLVAELIQEGRAGTAPVDEQRLAEARARVRLLEFVADDTSTAVEALGGDADAARPSAGVEIVVHLIRSNRAAASRPYLMRLAADPTRGALSELDRCLVRAHLERLDGDAERAWRWVEAGLAEAETDTVFFGVADLRTLAMRRIQQLGDLGVALAIERGSVIEAASIVDRVHAVSRHPEPRMTALEAGLVARLRELRHLEMGSSTDSEEWADLIRERSQLEFNLRSTRRHQSAPREEIGNRRPGGRVGGDRRQATAFFYELDGRALVFYLEPGDASLFDLGPAVRLGRQITALTLLLDAVASGSASRGDLAGPVRLLGSTLAPVIERSERDTLVVVPDARYPPVPWALLTSRPVTLMPTAVSMPADHSTLAVDVPLQVVAGPDLDHSMEEVAEIEQAWGAVDCLGGEQATVSETLATFGRAAMVHVSAHGRLRRDNPLFSEVRLSDGPLTFYDLLNAQCPRHVVLAACEIGRDSVSSPVGAFSVLQSRGCTSMVASGGLLKDGSMGALMGRYYANLKRSLRPAAALSGAQQEVRDVDPSVSLLMCFGPA